MKNFLKALFPFLLLDILTFAVFPFLAIFTLVPVLAFTAHGKNSSGNRESGRIIRLGVFCYYFMLVFIICILFRIIFPYRCVFLCVVLLFIFAGLFLKRVSIISAAGIMANILTILFFLMVIPPKITPGLVSNFLNEKYATPVYLYMGTFDHYDPETFKTYNGVRSITSNADESRYYFTAKGDGAEGEFYSLFSLDPKNPTGVKKWSRNRIFDAELTPDETGLLATDYAGGRLLLLNPESLEIIKGVKTFPRPMFIIVDKTFDRVFVLHEIGGLFIQYGLPDLEEKSRKVTVSGPVDYAVDWKSGEMYTANWLFPFMMSELDLFRATIIRVKYPFSFSGSGIDLDNSRYRVYVANTVSGRISAVDRNTFKTVGKIRTLPGVRPVLVDEKRELIYAGNMLSPYLFIYNFGHEEIGKVFIGKDCRALYLTPATNKLLAGSIFGVIEIDVDAIIRDSGIETIKE